MPVLAEDPQKTLAWSQRGAEGSHEVMTPHHGPRLIWLLSGCSQLAFSVAQTIVFIEVPGFRGLGVTVGTYRISLQLKEKGARGPAHKQKFLCQVSSLHFPRSQVPWNTCVSWMALSSLWEPADQTSKNW